MIDISAIPESSELFFWKMQCKFGFTEIKPKEKAIVAYVLNAVVQNKGIQDARLLIASSDGGFITEAITPTNRGDRLVEGDLVLWLPARYEAEAAKMVGMDDHRSGWMGFVMAKISSAMQPSGQFEMLCKYH